MATLEGSTSVDYFERFLLLSTSAEFKKTSSDTLIFTSTEDKVVTLKISVTKRSELVSEYNIYFDAAPLVTFTLELE
jgi:hypothetical protein